MTDPAVAKLHRLGRVSHLEDRGKGLVFDIDKKNFLRGFAIKYNGTVYCYRNQCPHAGSEMDWTEGDFFDHSGELLVCATHGALFDPVSGKCVSGPCANQSLVPVPLKIDGDFIYAFI